jgi:uncharacterized protein (TIGR03032 family)
MYVLASVYTRNECPRELCGSKLLAIHSFERVRWWKSSTRRFPFRVSHMQSDTPLPAPATKLREINFRHSRNLPELLQQLQISLLVSTYQAGKLAVIGSRQGKLALSFHNFDRPMGVAIGQHQIAVGSRSQIWFLKAAPDIARRLQPPGQFDQCFLARRCHVTGEIQCHEMAFAGDELWIVNTLFSCLCTLAPDYSFVPRWQPPFISLLAAEDRCHLNGMALVDGKPKYVSALAQTDTAGGWRPNKVETGCLIDVASSQIIAHGFAMPHSPRVHAGKIWLLDSGRGQLVQIDPTSGARLDVGKVPGYSRGLAIHSNLAFVGLSKIRETSTFGGVPIAENRDELLCGVGVIELSTGRTVATFEFTTGVEEIFDVSVLPGIQSPAIRGPFATEDGEPTVWVVPEPGSRADAK